MKRVYPNSNIQKYYSVLFGLPSSMVLLALNIIVYLISYIIIYDQVLYTQYVVATLLHFLAHLLALYLVKSPLLTPKRALGLLLVLNIYSLATISILLLVLNNNLLIILSTITCSNTLLLLTYIGIHGLKAKVLLPYLTIYAAVVVIGVILMKNIRYLLASTIIPLIGISILYYINSHRANKYGAIELVALFLKNWLDGDRDIEEVFQENSVKENVNAHIIHGCGVAIIYPDIHFGPFRNTGSSMFPSITRKFFIKSGIEPIVLHGMGSHERNLASTRESIEYVTELCKAINNGSRVWIAKPFRVKHGDWEALVIPFSKIILAFISRPGKGIDDLPYSFQEMALKRSLENNVPPLILIDSHNWEVVEKIDYSGLDKLIDMIIDRVRRANGEYMDAEIGYAVNEVKGVPGVIDNISFLTIHVGGEKVGLLYIPGNNMAPGVRDELLKIIRENGYSLCEVITNDEHRETGLFSDYIYTPVQYSNELLGLVRKLVKEASDSIRKCELRYTSIKKEVSLMGDFVWKLLGLLEKAFYKSLILVIVYMVFTPILYLTLLSL